MPRWAGLEIACARNATAGIQDETRVPILRCNGLHQSQSKKWVYRVAKRARQRAPIVPEKDTAAGIFQFLRCAKSLIALPHSESYSIPRQEHPSVPIERFGPASRRLAVTRQSPCARTSLPRAVGNKVICRPQWASQHTHRAPPANCSLPVPAEAETRNSPNTGAARKESMRA